MSIKINQSVYWDGERHLLKVIYREASTDTNIIKFYNSEGRLHRNDGPAYIEEHSELKNIRSAMKDVAHVSKDGENIGIINNIINKQYIIKEEWHIDGKRHRTDGPAFIMYNEDGDIKIERYHLNGKRIEDEFKYQVLVGAINADN